MPDAPFADADLNTFVRLDELGLQVVGQRIEPDRAVLACRVVDPDDRCRRCGGNGAARDTLVRRLAHEPLGWRPTVLLVTVRRYRCAGCGHVWRQDWVCQRWLAPPCQVWLAPPVGEVGLADPRLELDVDGS